MGTVDCNTMFSNLICSWIFFFFSGSRRLQAETLSPSACLPAFLPVRNTCRAGRQSGGIRYECVPHAEKTCSAPNSQVCKMFMTLPAPQGGVVPLQLSTGLPGDPGDASSKTPSPFESELKEDAATQHRQPTDHSRLELHTEAASNLALEV